jgi:hypothetical protein
VFSALIAMWNQKVNAEINNIHELLLLEFSHTTQ